MVDRCDVGSLVADHLARHRAQLTRRWLRAARQYMRTRPLNREVAAGLIKQRALLAVDQPHRLPPADFRRFLISTAIHEKPRRQRHAPSPDLVVYSDCPSWAKKPISGVERREVNDVALIANDVIVHQLPLPAAI